MIRKAFAVDYRDLLTKVGLRVASMGRALLNYVGRAIDFLANINLSVRAKILLSLGIVILLMGTTNAVLVLQALSYSRQYDAIIANITTANSISGYIKPAIDAEMWQVVAGNKEFKDGNQYQIINDVNTKVRWMMDNTDSHRAKVKLDVILRSMQTLTHYVDVMGEQIEQALGDGSRFGAAISDLPQASSKGSSKTMCCSRRIEPRRNTRPCAPVSPSGRFLTSF